MTNNRENISDLGKLTLVEAAKAIRAGQFTAVELTSACLDRISKFDPLHNVFISLNADAALERAYAADQALRDGVLWGTLHGVPLAHKDMFHRGGQLMTSGATPFTDQHPETTATVLSKLEAAGAVTLGTLNLSEFAASPTGRNIHFGDCHNAKDPLYISGGSSSGSAVAVGLGMVFGALGSDTGGSVRIPASANGVVGIKPTYGRVSRYGVMPRAFTLDCIGPIARTPADCSVLLSVIAGPDQNDPTADNRPPPPSEIISASPEKLTIGIAEGSFFDDVDSSVQEAIKETVKRLRAFGVTIRKVVPPDLGTYQLLGDVISKCEASTLHRRFMVENPERYSRLVYERTLAGLHIPASRYIEALCLRGREVAAFVDVVFNGVDALLMPTIGRQVPTISEVAEAEQSGDILSLISSLTRLTRPFNYLGLPAMSIPAGSSANKMPVGLQLVGRPFSEVSLLSIASLIMDTQLQAN
jgi:aspartyl-tRNA(Asn)/glutamyl-tRNA(Gln) amidotransferase subunit A